MTINTNIATRLPLRQRLRQSQPLLSTFIIIDAPEVVEMAALAGFDAVILDLEHGPYTVAQLPRLVLAARSRGAYAIVRVSSNDPAQIGAVLDVGADGVLVPQVGSAAAAALAVGSGRYAPEGMRGANPWTRAADFGSGAEWYARSNAETAVMVMIEGKEGLAALEEILAVPGLDAIFLGPVDMSQSLGVAGQTDHPLVIGEIQKSVEKAGKAGISVAIFSPNVEGAKRWRSLGAKLLAVGEDTAQIMQMFRRIVADYQAK
ncbi:HpcH/HpaI aldolase family protein [Ferrovibrio sp.]|uniref:HpcH/HpaI aldolase family protein n=1 Tax=Ferrovibrio sp. TaxID=1917215 RepID=UPI003D2DC3F6